MKGQVYVPQTVIRTHSSGKIDIYKRREELGHGGFATVYRVENEEINEEFALKATSRTILEKPKIMQKHKSEVAIQRSLDHPKIVKLYDFFEDQKNTYMVLELCPGNSVRDMLRKKIRLTEEEASKILRDVIDALAYLHDNRVIHRDLKLENFLVGEDQSVKIGDFGLSAKLDYDDERKYTVCGTPNYISPELLSSSSKGHSYEVDIWAIGVCAFAMLTGHPPFETKHTKLTYEYIQKCKYEYPPNLRISPIAKDFIGKILQINPKLRPSALELQMHPFITGEQPSPSFRRPLGVIENNANHNNEYTKAPKAEEKKSFATPAFCVSRFCDHSDKYGLGYLLLDGTIGACFNDLTRMVLDPFEEFVQYWKSYQDVEPIVLKMDDLIEKKKLAILRKFADSLKRTKTMYRLPVIKQNQNIPMHHVKYWMRNDDATLFRMNDRNIQVNFNDHMKMIIFWSTKKMAMMESIKKHGQLIPLEQLTHNDDLEDERNRFVIAKKMLAEMSGR